MPQDDSISEWERALAGAKRLLRPAQRRANWQYVRSYWVYRRRHQFLWFRVLRWWNSLGRKSRSFRESTRIGRLILRSILVPFLLALALVATGGLLELCARHLMSSMHATAAHLRITASAYGEAEKLRLKDGPTSTLLGTLAQVAGVFLGLYFAVVGTLVSTRYAQVPPKVRDRIIAEKSGNQYIKLVALFGAVATLLLAAQSLAIPVGTVNLVIVTILGVGTILSFVVLGRRVFVFFDPGVLVDQLGAELAGWIDRAGRLRHYGRQPSFQDYYRKQAAELLSVYDGVLRTAAEGRVSRQHTLPSLAQHSLRVLAYYEARKNRLASESYWFPRRYEHRDWLTSDFTATSVALQTGTALSPKEVPDLLWFERAVTDIFWFAYRKLLHDRSTLDKAVEVGQRASEAMGQMGRSLLMREAAQFAHDWGPLSRAEAVKTKCDEDLGAEEQRDIALRLASAECYALGSIRWFLSFAEAVSGEANDRLRASLAEPHWLSDDRIFELDIPRPLVVKLEGLRSLVDFESRVEGARCTAPWFFRQRIAFAYCAWYRDSLEAIMAQFESVFGADLEALVSESCWLASASLGIRALEACSKLRHYKGILQKSLDGWMEWRGHASGEWPSVDWSSVAERVGGLEKRVEGAVSACLVPLSEYKNFGTLPDFFGQALVVTTEACLSAIISDRDQRIGNLFPKLFVASLAAYERLKANLKGESAKTIFMFGTEPIDNLMELSGYAIVYSELGPANVWATVKAVWETYFKSSSDPAADATWLAALMNARGSQFGLAPGAMQRVNWKQSFQRDMRLRGLLAERWSGGSRERGRAKGHASPIVRALLRGSHVYPDLSDVFLVVYLREKVPPGAWPSTSKLQSFADALTREMEPNAEDPADGEVGGAE